ncbi:MAG: adenosylcobinamide-GDP ribazoletransferase [Coriobacteriia bacterium]|nr:adenosylcobinamide-GDP ribazoletransferase [Coriobacteriia bacterium]
MNENQERPESSSEDLNTAVQTGEKTNPVFYEVKLFFTALMFYTRIPVPKWTGYSDEQLNLSTRYFPAIGWVVGGVYALIILVTGLFLPVPLAVCTAIACGILLTGAFHEDGFADVCDGFGGGMTAERTLEIMKDSRVGAYAVIGLIALFGVKITAITALISLDPWYGLFGLVFAHVLSRFNVVTIIFTDLYARADMTSKVKPIGNQISVGGLIASAVWLLPFIFLIIARPWWFLAVPVAFIVRLRLGSWFKRRIGGYTGDCLGAAQQVMELLILITILLSIGILAAYDGASLSPFLAI